MTAPRRALREGSLFSVTGATEIHDRLFDFLERTTPSAYDRIMDQVYRQTHIGGGGHRTFDGSHTFAGSYREIQESLGDVDIPEFFQAHLNELVTPEGIPFFTLDHDAYDTVCSEIADSLGGFVSKGDVGSFVRDTNSVNAPEMLSSVVGTLFLAAAIRSGDTTGISRIVAANLCYGLAYGNPSQVLVGLSGLAYGFHHGKIRSWELLQGAAPIGAGVLAYDIIRDATDLGDGGSLLFGLLISVGVSQLVARLDERNRQQVIHELDGNKNYIAVMTPEVLQRELDILKLRCGRLSLGI